ncbi:hypothetical protein CPB84DRAFT_1767708 [Gymnopilus junonius]|uniref:Uncharacterized protein n=1 Tax=Gymnopilus junonius TaxID=109634 RepID=A0A9P5TQP5_GYMJU|nr:hypothetical protein CPB84DRAFT_1767708 [Gymnopilus junonius]
MKTSTQQQARNSLSPSSDLHLILKTRALQWIFTKDDSSSTYQIANASDLTYVLDAAPFASSGPDSRVICEEKTLAQAMRWRLTYGRNSNDVDGLYIVSADAGRNNVLLNSDISGMSRLALDASIRNIRTIDKDEEFRWKILEDSPASLPEGDVSTEYDRRYLIRTLNGNAVHSESGKKSLFVRNQNKGPQREWEIKSFGNGKCTIKNVQENAFLVTDKIDDRWEPVLSLRESMDKWDVQYLGKLNYTICIKPTTSGTVTERCYSLSLKEDTVVLREMKDAHNQIWHIEAKIASLDQPDPEHSSQTSATPEVNSTQGRKIIQNLMEGEYYLRNSGNGNYFLNSDGTWATINQKKGLVFQFEAMDNTGSGKVHISDTNTRKYMGAGPPYGQFFDHKIVWQLSVVADTTPTQYTINNPGVGNLGVSPSDTSYARFSGENINWTFIPKMP